MSDDRDLRQPVFDPFGEPMGAACPRETVVAGRRGYGETRRAAIVFWALALLFVAGRICVADGPSAGTFAAHAPQIHAPLITDTQLATLR